MAGRYQERKELKTPDEDENCVPVREPFLPQDIIVEILSQMQVKSLMKMRCVCKQWNDLTQDRHFIEKHMSHANSPLQYYFIKGRVERNGEGDDAGDDHYDNPENETFYVVCGCDGMLVKRSNASQKYLIQNPATRKILYLPETLHLSLKIFFSFVPSTGEYKLVSVYRDTTNSNVGCEVITAGVEDSWRPLELPNSHGLNGTKRKLSITTAGAAVHYFRVIEVGGEIFEEVVSLDLESECFTSTTLEPGLFSDWKKVSALNWNGRPALGEIGVGELKVLVIEDYKQHKLAENKFGVPLGGVNQDMQGDDVVPLLAVHGILWVWVGYKKIYGYGINHGRVCYTISAPEGYRIGRAMYVGRESLATLKGMQRLPSSWLA